MDRCCCTNFSHRTLEISRMIFILSVTDLNSVMVFNPYNCPRFFDQDVLRLPKQHFPSIFSRQLPFIRCSCKHCWHLSLFCHIFRRPNNRVFCIFSIWSWYSIWKQWRPFTLKFLHYYLSGKKNGCCQAIWGQHDPLYTNTGIGRAKFLLLCSE